MVGRQSTGRTTVLRIETSEPRVATRVRLPGWKVIPGGERSELYPEPLTTPQRCRCCARLRASHQERGSMWSISSTDWGQRVRGWREHCSKMGGYDFVRWLGRLVGYLRFSRK